MRLWGGRNLLYWNKDFFIRIAIQIFFVLKIKIIHKNIKSKLLKIMKDKIIFRLIEMTSSLYI